jgi:hypothetical protein
LRKVLSLKAHIMPENSNILHEPQQWGSCHQAAGRGRWNSATEQPSRSTIHSQEQNLCIMLVKLRKHGRKEDREKKNSNHRVEGKYLEKEIPKINSETVHFRNGSVWLWCRLGCDRRDIYSERIRTVPRNNRLHCLYYLSTKANTYTELS